MNALLQKLANDFFQNSLDSSPTSAIMRGYKEYFDKIEELTEEKFNSEKESVESFLSRLDAINFEELSTRERMSQILERMKTESFIEFTSLFDVKEGKIGVVVTFLAILELLKDSLIEIVQSEEFGP